MLWDITQQTAAMLVERETPLEAEHLLSSLVGIWERTDLGGDDPVEVIGVHVVDAAEAEASPRAFALLRGLAVFGGERIAPRAHAAASRLAELRTEAPAWVDSLGGATLRESWKTTEPFGDGDNVTLVLQHEGYAPHAISVFIDHNLDSIAKDVFVSPHPDRLRALWKGEEDFTVVGIDPQEAADALAQGLFVEESFEESPATDELQGMRPLLRAYLWTLPPPRPIRHPTMSDGDRDRLAVEFAASPEVSELASEVVDDLAWRMIDFARDHSDGDPLRWSPVVVELFMADWLPGRALLEVPLDAVPDAVRAWVRFAGRRRGLPERLIDEAVAAVGQWEDEFAHAMQDRSRFGPTKAVLSAMLDQGIDITDEAAMETWTREFNALTQEERRKVLP
jgi:hypothetical protein